MAEKDPVYSLKRGTGLDGERTWHVWMDIDGTRFRLDREFTSREVETYFDIDVDSRVTQEGHRLLQLGLSKSDVAKRLHSEGYPSKTSTGIHDFITHGYGELDSHGFWEFPLPDGEFVGGFDDFDGGEK